MINYIKTICQLPVSFLLHVVVLIERGLTWCLVRLSNPLCPFTCSVLKRIVKKREAAKDICSKKDVFDVRPNISVFRDWLKGQDDDFIESYRFSMENEFGVPAHCKDKDSHLYAVCRPSRDENIKRIAYSLSVMNTIELQHWLSEKRELIQ